MAEPDLRLADELRSLGAHVELPDTGELAPHVAARLRDSGRPRHGVLPVGRRRRAAVLVLVVLLLAFAVALAVPPARSGLLDLLGLDGVHLVRVTELPPAAPAGGLPAVGERVPLAEARRRVGFPLALPAGIGQPSAVVVDPRTGAVVLVWGNPTRLRLVEVPATYIIEKLAYGSTQVERVRVGGAPGIWFSGPRHVVLNLFGQPEVAGSTLVWQRGGITFRLDGVLTRDEALRLAARVR